MTSPTQRALSHEPVRTCVGCRERATKVELLRVVRGTDSAGRMIVVADPQAAMSGRGAYLHPTVACLTLAERRRAFGRALRYTEGSLSLSEVRTYLEAVDPATTAET